MATDLMTWQQFSKVLFNPALEDADPGYMMLGRAPLPEKQKMRFMAAWVTFYNPGIAAAASEFTGKEFWDYLRQQYPTAKRASERRHFRGNQGMTALDKWSVMFPKPESMVDHMLGGDYFEVALNAKTVPQIGEYFVWKFADVQERVFRIACIFPNEAAAHSPKVPQQGAKLINPDKSVLHTYREIAAYMNTARMKAPPWYDRPMNMQEAETVCCVYKQYRNGKWCAGSRTAKATRSLLATKSETGEIMLEALHSRTGVKRKEMNAWQSKILDQLGH